jgi:hypothetical protein
LEEWASAPGMPIFVRKHKDNRGFSVSHPSGRELVPTDNSPAHWVFTLACAGVCPTLKDVQSSLANHSIPIAMIRRTIERNGSKYTCTLGNEYDVNMRGWKLGHVEGVGMRQRKKLDEMPIDTLTAHFRRFMDPGNMFVVPLKLAGIAEVSHVSQLFTHAGEA